MKIKENKEIKVRKNMLRKSRLRQKNGFLIKKACNLRTRGVDFYNLVHFP